jgi:hypothetical protein
MPPKRYPQPEFNQRRINESWKRIDQINDDYEAFISFVNDPQNASNEQFGSYAMAQVKQFFPEVAAEVGPAAANPGPFTIYLDLGKSQNFMSLFKKSNDLVLVWSCWKSEEEKRKNEADLDGAGCLSKLAVLATGNRPDIQLRLVAQEDNAFMWKAASVHPLQVLENAYQRVVHKAGKEAESDAIKAQSETLSRFFIQDAGKPECFQYKPLDAYDGEHLGAVRMNHLIDSFYLFRLLVQYQVESGTEISESLRVELSGDLTKLLHNGDRTKMGWLSVWLTKKIAELGTKIGALNKPGQKRVIFFLKGGRALNYFLGTPEKGENDWDTQVVIDPRLSAEEWYRCYAEVHDVLLVALKTFKTEFTQLVQQNSAGFAAYLKDKAGPEPADDEEVDENEANDSSSLGEHAKCKAELIDIGIPRRDSASALEEWTRLSAPDALKTSNGVVFPHREYYLNEYLMMIRDAFLPDADVAKAPKRITRFGLILAAGDGQGPSPHEKKLIEAVPESAKKVAALDNKVRRELFGVALPQFVEAYNLLQDRELAGRFDSDCAALISNPPKLSTELAALLNNDQQAIAVDVGVAHALSARMDEHWAKRNEFFAGQSDFFADFVFELFRATKPGLRRVEAQFALAGSYAARLHARHLRQKSDGLEPVRRILVKLHCARGADRVAVFNSVADTITDAAKQTGKLVVTQGEKQALLVYWGEKVKIGNFTYAPLVMKIRVAEQSADQLPVLSSIEGVPVLDLRYLVADYLRKTSKIDERGSRRVLASATAACSEMLSRFDFDSDDEGEAPEAVRTAVV